MVIWRTITRCISGNTASMLLLSDVSPEYSWHNASLHTRSVPAGAALKRHFNFSWYSPRKNSLKMRHPRTKLGLSTHVDEITTKDQVQRLDNFSGPDEYIVWRTYLVILREDERYFLQDFLHQMTREKSFQDMRTASRAVYATNGQTRARPGCFSNNNSWRMHFRTLSLLYLGPGHTSAQL